MKVEQAKTILDETLLDSTLHNVIGAKPILTEKENVIAFAEIILFDIYGKEQIEKQKPYDVFEMDEYWLITGTLDKEKVGGTFLIIIDSRNCEIIRLTHWR